MIISTKLLFIHIPKSAGSSITAALNKELPGASKGPFPYQHYTLQDYYNSIGSKTLDNLFIFGIIRNPWERMYSWYEFNKKQYHTMPHRFANQPALKEKQFDVDFNEWLLTKQFIPIQEYKFTNCPIPAQKRSQFNWLFCKERQPDYIGQVEKMDELIMELIKNDLVKESFSIPHINVTNQGKKYKSIYSKESKEWIEHHFQKDIEYGQYTF